MKLPIIALVGALALVGCTTTDSNALITDLTNLANTGIGDFNNVIAVANAATPPDADAVPCAQAGITVVTAMQKVLAASPTGSTVGVFTVAEVASLYQPGSAQEQFVVKTIETGCIAKFHDVLASGASMVGPLATLAAVVSQAGM